MNDSFKKDDLVTYIWQPVTWLYIGTNGFSLVTIIFREEKVL